MNEPRRKQGAVLIVDDEEGIRHGLERLFRKEGYEAVAVDDLIKARKVLEVTSIDVAIVDVRLKNETSGLALVAELKAAEPDAIIIVITGYGSIDTAVKAMKDGASEYMVKPIDNIKLLDYLAKNRRLRSLQAENTFLRSELYNKNRAPHEMVSQSPQISFLLNKADKIKNSSVTALITGESGTGKEVLARYLHFTSNRKDASFVSLNCAALSESLLLSELFGHERGAFTGAIERKAGKFEIADGGTLFLDEVGDMPIEIQAKLLRVIEESTFERVGGTRSLSVDVRILAATNKNLEDLIQQGKFRDDLYYRINVVSFHLPPLRERREDIPLLVDHFIQKYNVKYKKDVERLCPELMAALAVYALPGNVRELENLINQAVLLSDGPEIPEEFFFKGFSLSGEKTSDTTPVPAHGLKASSEGLVEHHESQLIRKALTANKFNKSKTARQLGITRKTLDRKILKYGMGGNSDGKGFLFKST